MLRLTVVALYESPDSNLPDPPRSKVTMPGALAHCPCVWPLDRESASYKIVQVGGKASCACLGQDAVRSNRHPFPYN